ncbi:MAG: hypothetical protein AAFQ94_02900 [Bacteroidota bacterium]
MQNDPELNPKKMGQISSDFLKVADLLKESAYQIKKRGFSDYPIFPISKNPSPIGQLLYEKEVMKTDWNYYVTYLDEFLQRKLIDEDKKEDFVNNFKDPEEFCCLFVIEEEFTNFVFIPYPID